MQVVEQGDGVSSTSGIDGYQVHNEAKSRELVEEEAMEGRGGSEEGAAKNFVCGCGSAIVAAKRVVLQ